MAVFMASFAALTHIGFVHYFCFSCFLACFFLWIGFLLTFTRCDPLILGITLLIGFVVSWVSYSTDMNYLDIEDKTSVFFFGCFVYIIVCIYIIFAMFFIIGRGLDDNDSIGENVILSVL